MIADFEKGTKVCSKCRRELSISEFNKNKSMKDGLHNQCKNCFRKSESAKKYRKSTKRKEVVKRYCDKKNNTFGRTGNKRGQGNILKRDYELTEEQLQKRNNHRHMRKYRKERTNPQGILIWYSGLLDDLSSKEYGKILTREYSRQKSCAIRGCIGRVKPSEHFLFDFDLEQMLKDNVYRSDGISRVYIHKWWKGEIRHWTVNDGVWKDGK